MHFSTAFKLTSIFVFLVSDTLSQVGKFLITRENIIICFSFNF